jgi:hypothetical protein
VGLPDDGGGEEQGLTVASTQAEIDAKIAEWKATNVYVSSDLGTLYNVEVSGLQIGAGDVCLFAGINGPYKTDTDGDGDYSDETANADAMGLWIEDVDFGFALLTPTLAALPGFGSILPKFYAVKATAASAGLVGLGQWVEAAVEGIAVNVNYGTAWPGGFGPPTVDWDTSFAAETTDSDGDGKIDPAGYEVKTGGDPVYIDFDWPQRIEVSAERVFLQVSQYVYLEGSFSFCKGPVEMVTVATGLPGDLGAAVELLGDAMTWPVRGRGGLDRAVECKPRSRRGWVHAGRTRACRPGRTGATCGSNRTSRRSITSRCSRCRWGSKARCSPGSTVPTGRTPMTTGRWMRARPRRTRRACGSRMSRSALP